MTTIDKHFRAKKNAPPVPSKQSELRQKNAQQQYLTNKPEREDVQRGNKKARSQIDSRSKSDQDARPSGDSCSKNKPTPCDGTEPSELALANGKAWSGSGRGGCSKCQWQLGGCSQCREKQLPKSPSWQSTTPAAEDVEILATPTQGARHDVPPSSEPTAVPPVRPAPLPQCTSPTPPARQDLECQHNHPSAQAMTVEPTAGTATHADASHAEASAPKRSARDTLAACVARWPCRERQIALLVRMLATGTDSAAPLLVAGPAGTGKTRLLLDVMRCAGVRHVYVSATSCASPRVLYESVVGQLLAYARAPSEGYARCPRRIEKAGEFVLEVRAAMMAAGCRKKDAGASRNKHGNSDNDGSHNAAVSHGDNNSHATSSGDPLASGVNPPNSSPTSSAAPLLSSSTATASVPATPATPPAFSWHTRGVLASAQQPAMYIIVDDIHRLRPDGPARKGPWAAEPTLLPCLCRMAELTGCNVAVVMVGRDALGWVGDVGASCGQVLQMPAYTREETKRVLERWPSPAAAGEPQMYRNFVRLLVDTHTAAASIYELREKALVLFAKYSEPTRVAGVDPGDTLRLSRDFLSFLKASGLLDQVLTASNMVALDSSNGQLGNCSSSLGNGGSSAMHGHGAAGRAKGHHGLPASLAHRQAAPAELPLSPFSTLEGPTPSPSSIFGASPAFGQARGLSATDGRGAAASNTDTALDMDLPVMSRYIILAAYVASRNANSLDARVFADVSAGRGAAGGAPGGAQRGRKRSSAGVVAESLREAEAAREAHLRLPGEFAVERMLAILQAILQLASEAGLCGELTESSWADTGPLSARGPDASRNTDAGASASINAGHNSTNGAASIVASPGQHIPRHGAPSCGVRAGPGRGAGNDVGPGRQALSLAALAQVGQLVSLGLLSRVVGPDPLDGAARFRCNVGAEFMNKIARNLGVPVHTYLPHG